MTDKAYAATAPAEVETPASPGRRRSAAWIVPLAAIALAIVVTGVYLQLTHPFIRHDDWPYTLRRSEPGGQDIFARNRYEGRWLNWLYWYFLGKRTSIVVASAIFFTSYAAYVWAMVRLLALTRAVHVFLVTFALMVSAIWIRLIYWPGTLSASMIVAAVAVWTLPLVQRHRLLLAAWMLVFTASAVLTYPPVAALLLFAVAVSEAGARIRRLLALGVGFVASYGFGVLLVYTFNWLAFGQFGVTISAWRQPNPLRSWADLTENVGRYGAQVAALSLLVGVAGLVGLTCIVWSIADPLTRRAGIIVLAATVIVVALEGGLTVVSGVITGTRASLWAWPAITIPAALLLKGIRWSRVAGVVALVAISVVGTVTWRTDLGQHQASRIQYDALIDKVATVAAEHPERRVVKWMEPAWRKTAQGNMTAVVVTQMMSDQHGIYPQWCTPSECDRISGVAHANPRQDVLQVGDLIVVRIPRQPKWL